MKIYLEKTFISPKDGKAIEKAEGVAFTLGDIVYAATNYVIAQQHTGGDMRLALSKIAYRTLNGGEIDVTADELAKIVAAVSATPIGPGQVVFQAVEMLQGS